MLQFSSEDRAAPGASEADLIAAVERARNRITITICPPVETLHPEEWGSSVAHLSADEWRANVHRGAPHRLQDLDVPHPFTRWRNACNEIHRAESVALRDVQEAFVLMSVGIEAMEVAEEREARGWVTSADLTEVQLRSRGVA